MKIGYPCINLQLGCISNSTFRLASYSNKKLIETVRKNLDCLHGTLKFNSENNLLFFRIGSGLIPFASHPICRFDWKNHFKSDFRKIGKFIRENKMRISMHPDQFVLINSLDKKIVRKSIREIEYHCRLLDLMELDRSAKVQIHIGGVYGDKEKSIGRFIKNYKNLSNRVKSRLVIENDDWNYSLKDCLSINKKIEIPVVFDTLHHQYLNNGESFSEAVKMAGKTWKKKDGILMVDYSAQKKGGRKGAHAESVNLQLFKKFLKETENSDFDIMLEIKDKEKSALKAVKLIK